MVVSWLAYVVVGIVFVVLIVHQGKTNPAPRYRNGYEYEKYVAWRLRNAGFMDVRVTKGSGDFGADILCRDGSGRLVAVQCKMYNGTVGVKAVQEAVAGMKYYHGERAMVVTTGIFTAQARQAAMRMGVELRERVV